MRGSFHYLITILGTLLLGFSHSHSAASCTQPSTYFWFSTSATSPQFAEVPIVNATSPTTLYVWARLDSTHTVTDLSLNVTSTTTMPIATADLDNPVLSVGGDTIRRYEHLPAPTITPQQIMLQGFTLFDQDVIGRGFGKAAAGLDPLFDAATGAWRVGSLTFSSAMDNTLTLQVGVNGIQGIDGNGDITPDFGVIFGDRQDTALCAMTQRGVSSQRSDAVITDGVFTVAARLSTSSYFQSPGAVLTLQIGEDKAKTPWQLEHHAQLDGTLQLESAGYVDPTSVGAVDEVPLITAASLTGQFDSVWLDGKQVFAGGENASLRFHEGGGLFRTLDYTDDSLTMVNYLALPADFNLDRQTNFADFLILSGNFGGQGDWTDGDATGNGIVEFADFLILSQAFGSVAGAVQSVPEPTIRWPWLATFTAACLLSLRCRASDLRRSSAARSSGG